MYKGIIEIINEALLKSKDFECFSYRDQFMIYLKELIDGEQKAVLELLTNVASYHMKLDNPKEPFEPFMIFDGKRSANVSDLSKNDFEVLKELYIQIDDCELKARIADVLWVGNKSYKHGQEAISYYLVSADRLEDWQHWCGCFERINRASQITLMLGGNNQKINDVNLYINSLIRKINGNDPLYLTGKLMELLQKQKIGYCEEYIDIIEKNVDMSNETGNFDKARYYIEVKSKWYQLLKENTKFQESIVDIAKSFEYEAQKLIDSNGDSSYMKIVYLLENAICTYRKIPNMQSDIIRLLKNIVQYKEAMKDGFKSISHSVDVTDVVKSIRETLIGRPLIDAIIKLAFIQNISDKESLKKRVIELHLMSPLSFLVNTDIVDTNGKRIIKMPDLRFEDENKHKEAIEAYMLKEAAANHTFFASAIVCNALKIINAEHEIKEDDLTILFEDNIFVQSDRKRIFHKGIYEGFQGNYMVAIHLLIPQLENSFREFAEMCGDVVTTFEDDGKEQAKPLNSIFELENFVSAYDEDLLFDLRSLLTEKYGSNMRNRLAHGLLSDDDSESSIAIYVWWITLRLCCMYSKGLNQYIQENMDILKE